MMLIWTGFWSNFLRKAKVIFLNCVKLKNKAKNMILAKICLGV